MDGLCGCIFVPGAVPFHVSWPSFALELSTLSLLPVHVYSTKRKNRLRPMQKLDRCSTDFSLDWTRRDMERWMNSRSLMQTFEFFYVIANQCDRKLSPSSFEFNETIFVISFRTHSFHSLSYVFFILWERKIKR